MRRRYVSTGSGSASLLAYVTRRSVGPRGNLVELQQSGVLVRIPGTCHRSCRCLYWQRLYTRGGPVVVSCWLRQTSRQAPTDGQFLGAVTDVEDGVDGVGYHTWEDYKRVSASATLTWLTGGGMSAVVLLSAEFLRCFRPRAAIRGRLKRRSSSLWILRVCEASVCTWAHCDLSIIVIRATSTSAGRRTPTLGCQRPVAVYVPMVGRYWFGECSLWPLIPREATIECWRNYLGYISGSTSRSKAACLELTTQVLNKLITTRITVQRE